MEQALDVVDGSAPPVGLRRLSPDVVRLWRIGALLSTCIATAIVAVAGLVFGLLWAGVAVGSLVIAVGLAHAVLWVPASYRSWGFAVRAEDVLIQHGVWWQRVSIVPHTRIQHVDTTHGPLERALGLASVVLFTAGTVGASLSIPGLPIQEAEMLRDQLAALGRAGDGV